MNYSPSLALPFRFYRDEVQVVARNLVGQVLVAERDGVMIAGVIVETEAYGDERDLASHAAFRRTGVVRAMWGEPGTLYVYKAYGMYPCFNVVTGPEGTPSAVLIRSLSLLAAEADDRSASGPGRLGRMIGLDTADNYHRLHEAPYWIQPGETPESDPEIVTSTRIGVKRGDGRLWRFAVKNHPAVSRPRP